MGLFMHDNTKIQQYMDSDIYYIVRNEQRFFALLCCVQLLKLSTIINFNNSKRKTYDWHNSLKGMISLLHPATESYEFWTIYVSKDKNK
jgi:hypothetical protein